MNCDTIKALEHEAAMRLNNMTVEQAYRMADHQRARDVWSSIMELSGPKQKVTALVYALFLALLKD